MDTVTTITDAVIDADVDLDDTSFAQETGKTLVTIAAITAGMVAGSYLYSKARTKVAHILVERRMKAAMEQVHVVTDLTETETVEN